MTISDERRYSITIWWYNFFQEVKPVFGLTSRAKRNIDIPEKLPFRRCVLSFSNIRSYRGARTENLSANNGNFFTVRKCANKLDELDAERKGSIENGGGFHKNPFFATK